MTENSSTTPTDLFIARLEALDAGDRARLKRNAGKTLAEAHDALGLFYRLLPKGVPAYQEEVYFLVATLFPLADGGAENDLGMSLYRAQSVKIIKGLTAGWKTCWMRISRSFISACVRRSISCNRAGFTSIGGSCSSTCCSGIIPIVTSSSAGRVPILVNNHTQGVNHVDPISHFTELCPFQPQPR